MVKSLQMQAFSSYSVKNDKENNEMTKYFFCDTPTLWVKFGIEFGRENSLYGGG